MIDSQTVQKIKDAADIVEVVSDYVHLVRRGANFMGLCPFHNERTPSFSVNRQRNFCYCFSCHKGGSPVNFIMEKEGISYHDALLHLAKKYGIKVEEKELTDEEREQQSRREGLLVANEWAMRKMEEMLSSTEEGQTVGLQYLYGRGVTAEAIKHFHLGYSLDSFTAFTDSALKTGFDLETLKTLGLTGTGRNGMSYDRFKGRVMFPVINSSGKVVAFGGRDLKGGLAKYVNSPESEIYHKSNELYGMFQARPAIVREDNCFLVEGYLDVIGMWQAGIQNVVASSGTALTDNQIGLIHRFTSNVTLVYDGDKAGIKAALRGIDMLLSHKLNLKVLLLPDGEDPDSFARKCTPEQFRQYVADNQTDMIRFKTNVLLNDAADDPMKRVEAIQSVVESIACISDKVARDIYVQECSRLMNVQADTVMAATEKARLGIVEKWKQERERRKFASETSSSFKVPDAGNVPTEASLRVSDSSEGRLVQTNRRSPSSVLEPLEKTIIQYCIRYGFINLCELEDESYTEKSLTLVEFVDEELAADNIVLTTPVYTYIFERLKQLLPDFKRDLADYEKSIADVFDRKRNEGYDSIAEKNLSMQEIAREEKELESRLNMEREVMIKSFSKDYASRILASDADHDIRTTVTEFICERHQLSNLFMKNNPGLPEVDRMNILMPRALTELKNGILDLKLKELMHKFRNETNSDTDIQKLQSEITTILSMRAEVARNIGERIISPRRKTK